MSDDRVAIRAIFDNLDVATCYPPLAVALFALAASALGACSSTATPNDAGNPGRAEGELKKALDLDHSLGDAYWQRGVLLQKKGESISALSDLQTAIEKRPSRFEAYATMALCFQDLLKWPEAEGAWKKAIAANGAVAEWHYRLAKIYVGHGNAAGAGPDVVRLSIGLEDADDLIDDLKRALKAAEKAGA